MRLLFGLPFNDQRHFDFEVNLLTLGGECAALEKIAELELDNKESLTQAEQMMVDLAYLSEQIHVRWIPKDVLTPKFLLKNLTTDDYVLITQAIAELRKKHIADGESPNPPNGE
ncbi:Uncharacterised protein [Rodentibacter pneumotropicus]|uniref:Uncharacterized protein n=1 Tax=Rodentibacter pneumotropicus TaxID=758 RepID=A0A448MJW0_9PAST|nr:Uncharacterised protein [Rodentibacter pneumotropicus]